MINGSENPTTAFDQEFDKAKAGVVCHIGAIAKTPVRQQQLDGTSIPFIVRTIHDTVINLVILQTPGHEVLFDRATTGLK